MNRTELNKLSRHKLIQVTEQAIKALTQALDKIEELQRQAEKDKKDLLLPEKVDTINT